MSPTALRVRLTRLRWVDPDIRARLEHACRIREALDSFEPLSELAQTITENGWDQPVSDELLDRGEYRRDPDRFWEDQELTIQLGYDDVSAVFRLRDGELRALLRAFLREDLRIQKAFAGH